MTEVLVGGNKYQIEPFGSVFTSYEIARELGPVLAGLSAMKRADKEGKQSPAHYARAFCALSIDVSNVDVERATDLCLSSVRREQAGASGTVWVPIMATGARRMMFSDIDLPAMTELIWHVLEVNRLPDFFSALPLASGEGTASS